ncbi:MAG TPA: helix-turn-helix domain-containing protein [Longimicrobium sp.]|jgi:AraC-like DNA-binding protein|uniref:AraC family transcriptional regulator n=1 Tax=Longimicrobium sp. TaxID=2029185 RepID=UPI002ED89AF1
MLPFLAFLPDPVALGRLRVALRMNAGGPPESALVEVRGWNELAGAARSRMPELAVVDPCSRGVLDVEACAHFRLEFPSVVLLPYGEFRGTARDGLQLGLMGVRHLVMRDQEDGPAAFAYLLAQARAEWLPTRVFTAIGDLIPHHLRALVHEVVIHGDGALPPARVAALYHRHPNTLREHLRAAGLPPVNKLVVWMRLFRAGHLLEDPGRSVENVAGALAFASSSGLRNQLHRYAGLTASDVRRRGGLDLLLTQFRTQHLREYWGPDGDTS